MLKEASQCRWHPCAQCPSVTPTCFATEWSGPGPLPTESPPTALRPPWRTHPFLNTLSNGCLLCPLLETLGSLLFLAQALEDLGRALCQVQPPWYLPQTRFLPEPCSYGCLSEGGTFIGWTGERHLQNKEFLPLRGFAIQGSRREWDKDKDLMLPGNKVNNQKEKKKNLSRGIVGFLSSFSLFPTFRSYTQ